MSTCTRLRLPIYRKHTNLLIEAGMLSEMVPKVVHDRDMKGAWVNFHRRPGDGSGQS